MRILILAQFYPPVAGGEERHVQALAGALAQRGHDVDVLTTSTPGQPPGRIAEEVAGGRFQVHRAASTAQRVPGLHSDAARPHSPPLPDPAISRAIGQLLDRRRHDVVHAHDWIVQSALGPARRRGVPVVVTLHDFGEICATKRLVRSGAVCPGPSPARCVPCTLSHFGPTGPAVAAVNAVAAAYRRHVVTEFLPVSHWVARASRLAERGAPFTVVPNFVPDALVDGPAPGYDADGPLLYVGDVSADKGADVLLEAFGRLPGRATRELLLAGRRVGRAAQTVPDGARLLGEVSHAEVMALMARAYLVVVPSIYPDPCPTVVLEAMAAGRGVIASATGGIGDLVEDGVTGCLVAPADGAALSRAIERLLADPSAAARLGAAGRVRVMRFTASAVVAQVESAYCRAVEREA